MNEPCNLSFRDEWLAPSNPKRAPRHNTYVWCSVHGRVPIHPDDNTYREAMDRHLAEHMTEPLGQLPVHLL